MSHTLSSLSRYPSYTHTQIHTHADTHSQAGAAQKCIQEPSWGFGLWKWFCQKDGFCPAVCVSVSELRNSERFCLVGDSSASPARLSLVHSFPPQGEAGVAGGRGVKQSTMDKPHRSVAVICWAESDRSWRRLVSSLQLRYKIMVLLS